MVQGDELCRVSSLPLLSRPFYKFPCGCGIITEHLIEYVRGMLPRYKKEKLERLEDQLKAGVSAQREAGDAFLGSMSLVAHPSFFCSCTLPDRATALGGRRCDLPSSVWWLEA